MKKKDYKKVVKLVNNLFLGASHTKKLFALKAFCFIYHARWI